MLKVRALAVGVNQESRRVECLKKPCTRLAGRSTRTRVATSTSRSSSWCAISLAALLSSAAVAATPAPLIISSHALHAFASCARAQAIHVTQHGAPQEKLELAFKVPVPCTPGAKLSHRLVHSYKRISTVYCVFFFTIVRSFTILTTTAPSSALRWSRSFEYASLLHYLV